jgi:hypothetical protein
MLHYETVLECPLDRASWIPSTGIMPTYSVALGSELLSKSCYFPYKFPGAFSESVMRLCVQKSLAI